MKHKGFTIVELLIVLLVIAILTAIGTVSYTSIQRDAMDGKIKATVKDVGDAMALYESDTSELPPSEGHFQQWNGVRRLIPKYLKEDYSKGLKSRHAAHSDQIFRWYRCAEPGGDRGFVVYAALNNPKADDTANFTKVRNDCRHSEAHAPTSGQTQYNYARRF